MLVVLDEEAEGRLLSAATLGPQTAEPVPLSGVTAWLDVEESLVRVYAGESSTAPRHEAGVSIPCFALNPGSSVEPSSISSADLPGGQALLFSPPGSADGQLRAFLASADVPEARECSIEVVRLETDVFSRLKGIFDTRVLAAKTVAVIGLGSGGSVGTVELAKAGVGHFILADFDRLRAHNVSRHVCGLSDIGRYKTRAVRDAIMQHSPMASVECHEVDVTSDAGLLEQMVSASDLVLVATDNQLSRYLVNEVCLAAGVPAVYGGVYERAFAGEVVRVVPGQAGCYACVRQNLADTMRSISSQQQFDYTDDSDLQPEPGMGLDVSLIALLQAKVALMTLLRDIEWSQGDIDADMIIWTNAARPQDGKLFEQPLARYFVRVPKAKDCPACGEDGGKVADGGERSA